MKQCGVCGQSREDNQFVGESGKPMKVCLVCRIRRRKDGAKRRANGKLPAYRRFKQYGLTIEQFDALILKQNGKCAICTCVPGGTSKYDKFHVDHDHKTEKVRGLLCGSCNLGIGHLGDDTEKYLQAIEYIKSWRNPEDINFDA